MPSGKLTAAEVSARHRRSGVGGVALGSPEDVKPGEV